VRISTKVYEVSSEAGENVLNLIVIMVEQFSEYSNNH
jgi:hypothetical protein